MLIAVQYRDGSFDMVKSFKLDNLISSGGISLFRRATGWVAVGRDPVRRPLSSGTYYVGTERRSEMN